MRNDTRPTEAGRQYEAAYAAHYTMKDLHGAFKLYRDIMTAHPNTREAEYSRSQIQNIMNGMISRQELLDVQMDLVLPHFEPGDQEDVRPASIAPRICPE